MKKTPSYLWVIGGGQLQAPLIEEARKLELGIIVTDRNPQCLCRKLADKFYPIDIFDINKNTDLLFALQEEGIRLAGIIAAGIDANVTAAILARLAGLPGVSPQAAYKTHNKAAFRKFLSTHNLPCPRWREVKNGEELKKAITAIGFPLIVKNVDSSASRGTKKFFAPAPWQEITEVFNHAREVSSTKSALVEELLEGEEQTVETLFDIKGTFHPCFITDRIFDRESSWAVEQVVRHPTTLTSKQQKNLYTLVEHTASALGITTGAAKADTIMTKKGPVILEMTTRLSGGFDCQYIVPLATGKNVLRAAILTAIGKPFPSSLLKDTKKRVVFSGSIWPEPGKTIAGTKGLEKARRMPGFGYFFMNRKKGDRIEPYTDGTKRVCFLIVSGKNYEEAYQAFESIRDTIGIITH